MGQLLLQALDAEFQFLRGSRLLTQLGLEDCDLLFRLGKISLKLFDLGKVRLVLVAVVSAPDEDDQRSQTLGQASY